MKVFCYFSPNPDLPIEFETKLILLWRESWEKYGYTPVVLNEWHARQHPMFADYDAAISKLPSVNPPGYDRACYLRWLAVAHVLSLDDLPTFKDLGILTDYDVMSYGWHPSVYPSGLTTWEGKGIDGERPGHTIPSVVTGTKEDFETACLWFASYEPTDLDVIGGKKHTSDMYVLEKHAAEFTQRNVCKVFGEEGWETAELVHFCNASMIPKGFQPRSEHIRALRPI